MRILLGSKSPRRQKLLKAMGYEFDLVQIDCEENYEGVEPRDVAEYLARKKSEAYGQLNNGEILITADTTVLLGTEILNKPADDAEAFEMLRRLSGTAHKVISGVAIRSKEEFKSFTESTEVHMLLANDEEIRNYIRKYRPLDKAGAYGIQEWIGMAFINRIDGSYFNVMGLPTATLYSELKKML
jgi:septum formation protein